MERKIKGLELLPVSSRVKLRGTRKSRKNRYVMYPVDGPRTSESLTAWLNALVPQADLEGKKEERGYCEFLNEDNTALERLLRRYGSSNTGAVRLYKSRVAFGFVEDMPKTIFDKRLIHTGNYFIAYHCLGERQDPNLWIVPKNLKLE